MRLSLGRVSGTRAIALAAVVVAFLPTASRAETHVSPYIEVEQVLDADLNGGETLTYTSIAAGIDASVATKRTQAQISYRYERRIAWGHHDIDEDAHTGLARVDYALSPNLTLEAGGIAARARTDNRGATPVFLTGNDDNVSQIYGVYAGPSFARKFGDLDLTASYRLGFVHVDQGYGALDLGPGQPVLDSYSSSISHDFEGSLGMGVGALPFSWTVSGGYVRENVNRLRQHNDDQYLRGDITFPVTYTFAVTGGVGYEKVKSSQQDILRAADGSAILTSRRRFKGDPNAPRLLAYDYDGMIYDGGAIWRPNHRTTLEVHAGKRYGEKFVTGTLDYRINEVVGFQAAVYNDIQSFGRQLTNRIASMPTAFRNPINPLVGNLDGCVFGTAPGTGGCLGDALQSVTTSDYRSKGVYALLSGGRGRWTWGLGAGYNRRTYLAPASGTLFSLDGVKDDSATAEATLTREMSRNSSLSGTLYASWYDSGIVDTSSTTSLGGTVTYNKNFSNHLSGQAALGIYTTQQDGSDDGTFGTALVGVRYQF